MSTVEEKQSLNAADVFRRKIKTAYKQVKSFIEQRGNKRLTMRWEDWDHRFREVYKQSDQQPEVEISLVGGTGAGKSTLVNALIGERVLPISNMKACTAAISEVSYCSDGYKAKVEFLSRDEWEKEISLLRADISDSSELSADDGTKQPQRAVSRAAVDRLWTVYRESDDTPKNEFDCFSLKETEEVKEALDKGYVEFSAEVGKDFSKRVAVYLDSKHRFWPIVKTVSISGPFESLKDGAKLVDLPGVNDPNEAREAVTKKHLKTCRFVWIVFNIKRALTADTMSLMQSDDFLRQIVMDGRADALTFVGTASDDIDIETALEEFSLTEDASTPEVIAARNSETRKIVTDQLDDLGSRMAELANESQKMAEALAKKLKRSQVITVSAREHLRLSGLARTQVAGLETVEQTEIPQLQQHMNEICRGYGVEAHIATLDRQLNTLVQEIKREISSQRAGLKERVVATAKQKEDLRAAEKAARDFLVRDLEDSRERFVQDLQSSEQLLAERIRRAVDRAHSELDDTLRRWSRTHHGTIRAVCRRGGVYVGTGGRNDFPEDLCKPILNGIAFAWTDFFGDKLTQLLEKWSSKLQGNAEEYRRQLMDRISQSKIVLPNEVQAGVKGIFNTTEKIVDEILSQIRGEMETKITEKQRTLYERVPDQVQANMQSAFEEASQETGAGMKQRMIDILSVHAKEVSKVMFDDAQKALLDGVRSLNDWLAKKYQKMAQRVEKNAGLASEHLTIGPGELDESKLQEQQELLTDLESLLKECLAPPQAS